MVKTISVGIILLMTCTGSASAGSWSAPEWNAEVGIVGTSDLFPGYAGTAADRAVRTAFQVGTDRRLSPDVKFAVQLDGGWLAYRHFDEERHGWAGATLALRRGGSQIEFEGAHTPDRVKFPSAPEDASFRRNEQRLGLRQTLHERARLRLDFMREDDDYVAAFDARDGVVTSGRAIVRFKVSPTVALIARGERSGRETEAPDYRFEQTESGAGIEWAPARWGFGAEFRSGVRRYTEAPESDSNFQRRDQWLETLGTVKRGLGHQVSLRLAAGFRNQTSSRLDRMYDTTTWAAGFEWSGGGD